MPCREHGGEARHRVLGRELPCRPAAGAGTPPPRWSCSHRPAPTAPLPAARPGTGASPASSSASRSARPVGQEQQARRQPRPPSRRPSLASSPWTPVLSPWTRPCRSLDSAGRAASRTASTCGARAESYWQSPETCVPRNWVGSKRPTGFVATMRHPSGQGPGARLKDRVLRQVNVGFGSRQSAPSFPSRTTPAARSPTSAPVEPRPPAQPHRTGHFAQSTGEPTAKGQCGMCAAHGAAGGDFAKQQELVR